MTDHDNKGKLLAGIEAGGTKFNCVIARSPLDVIHRKKIPTTNPEETFSRVFAYFSEQEKIHGPIDALGIASFGPLDLHKNSPSYGFITATPKPHWSHTDVLSAFKDFRDIPMAFDTDVNGAALGEWRYGAAQKCAHFIYITVGTGIGGGVFANGQPLNGTMHLEVGHMLLPVDPAHRVSPSPCPFHENCLSAVACGPAMGAIWKTKSENLPIDHEAWQVEAHYLAMMCMNLSMLYSPERILLGGGVMEQEQLFPMIRSQYLKLLGDYMVPSIPPDQLIIPPGMPGRSGEVGALIMAEQAWKDAN